MFIRTMLGRTMPAQTIFSVSLAMILSTASPALAQDNKPQSSNPPRQSNLVESVAVCGQCHTPRDSHGNLDRTRWLQGGSVPYLPAKPDSNWPISAPRLGGTPPASDADMIKLLTTGIWTNGNPLRLPMPQFRMDRSDAEAVVAYLKSVTQKQ